MNLDEGIKNDLRERSRTEPWDTTRESIPLKTLEYTSFTRHGVAHGGEA